jgi:hypothetical protein
MRRDLFAHFPADLVKHGHAPFLLNFTAERADMQQKMVLSSFRTAKGFWSDIPGPAGLAGQNDLMTRPPGSEFPEALL